MNENILVTICARGGSKGLKNKNILSLLGKPLIGYSIEQAMAWPRTTDAVVSTDSVEIAEVAKNLGARVPFIRPAELAGDTASKIPVIAHAMKFMEEAQRKTYDLVVDLDVTSPIRTISDLDRGYDTYVKSQRKLCFSVTAARKNPYFNQVERNEEGKIRLVKETKFFRRQDAPQVWDMNASIYFYPREYLLSGATSLWSYETEAFEMPPESAFDIDHPHDFLIVESIMKSLALSS